MTRFATRLRGDARGVSTVEFGLLLTPFLMLLMGGMDVGHQYYIRAVTQGALDDASRRASVEDPKFVASGSTTEARVAATLKQKIGVIAPNATYTITQRNYFDFNGIGNPERLVTDADGNGKYDESDGDCFEDLDEDGVYDLDSGRVGIGGANDVSFYSVNVRAKRLLPTAELFGFPAYMDFTVETAVRNQPYGSQKSPPVICGTAP